MSIVKSEKEKYGIPEKVFYERCFATKLFLNSTPLWRKCASALSASHSTRRLTSRHGAISHGSLVRAQTRSCFIICAAARFACCAAVAANLPFSAKKYCRKGYIFCSIFLSIAKAMVYHHALACISSPKAYIISRRLYHFRNDDMPLFEWMIYKTPF